MVQKIVKIGIENELLLAFLFYFWLLFQSLAVRECVADFLAQLDIAMMNRVEDNQLHLFHVWISVFCQILLIYKNIDDFSNEIIAGFAFVILLLDAALQGSSGNR
jgi:hypothetical protein